MNALTAVCLRLVALSALCALLTPAAEKSAAFPGLKLIAGC